MSLCLSEISTELLIKIFTFVSIKDLYNLKRTCKRFNEIIKKWDHSIVKRITLVTNQKSENMLSRSRKLSALEKIRISQNWLEGSYLERIFLHNKQKYRPHLQLHTNYLWLSRGNRVFQYKRNKKLLNTQPICTISGESKADVERFSFKNNLLVSGNCDGSMWLWSMEKRRMIFDLTHCHESDINGIDIDKTGRYIATGSRDESFKIWQTQPNGLVNEYFRRNYSDRVWCVSIQDETDLVAVGTSGIHHTNSIFIYNVLNPVGVLEFPSGRLGAGILDFKWYDKNTLFSSDYDGYIKLWDLRSGRCETKFCDFHDSVFCSIDTDHFNTLISGSQIHGRIVLWDIRKPPRCVQLYFLKNYNNYGGSMKIYTVAFDSEHIFTATEQNLHILNFSGYRLCKRDYSFAIPEYKYIL